MMKVTMSEEVDQKKSKIIRRDWEVRGKKVTKKEWDTQKKITRREWEGRKENK